MTADQLLQNVKDRAALPPAQIALTDTKLLQMATEELWAYIAPLLAGTNEEFFTDTTDIAIVANQAGYDIPTRAMGSGLRVVKWIDSNGNEGPPLNRIEVEDVGYYASLSSSAPIGFYATATQVVLAPTPTASSGSIRCYYTRRPGILVSDTLNGSAQHTQVGTIASAGATLITLAAAHSGFPANTTIDVIKAQPPFKVIAQDVTTTTAAAGSTTITVGTNLTGTTVAAGDYVTLAGYAYTPQIPLEWHSVLELRVCARAFAAINDPQGMSEALANSALIEKRLLGLSAPRFDGNSRKINAWRR